MVQAIQVLRFHLLELEKVRFSSFIQIVFTNVTKSLETWHRTKDLNDQIYYFMEHSIMYIGG